jgi:phage I-like protein
MPYAPVNIPLVFGPSLIALDADTKVHTTWIQVAKVGHWHSGKYGEFDITRQDIAEMLANFRAMQPPTQVPVDYDHLSTNVRQPGDGAAAGWYQDLQIRANGTELWGLVEFTEPAAKRIRSKEYRFVSPTFIRGWKDKATGKLVGTKLICSAITNHPFIEGMAAITLSMQGADTAGTADLAIPITRPHTGAHMKTIKIKDAAGNEVEVPETAITELDTVKSMQAQITELTEKVKKAPGDGQQVVDAAVLGTLTKSVEALTGKVTELSTELASTKAASTKAQAEQKVRELVRSGKIAADDDTKKTFVELAMNAPDQFEKVTSKLQPILKLNTTHGVDSEGDGSAGSAITEMQAKVTEAVTKAGGPSKLSAKDAIHQVSLSDPALANRYRMEMNQNPGATGPSVN